ncbi:M23 family metallopeptidase [Candidatus Woesearchaeota archaeon]|nr:M23 family metallopeptidase [Candidatus Woesearchaeota archaeon]
MNAENLTEEKRISTYCVLPVDPPIQIWQGWNSRDTHKRFGWGDRIADYSYCLDFLVEEGSPVYAARGGEVFAVEVGSNSHYAWKEGEPIDEQSLQRMSTGGNAIGILHDDGTFANYGHLQQGGSFVKVGQRVEPGQKIGMSGNTGLSSAPHLHFGIYEQRSEQLIQAVPFRLLDYDGPLEDRDIRPAASGFIRKVHTAPLSERERLKWIRLSDLA